MCQEISKLPSLHQHWEDQWFWKEIVRFLHVMSLVSRNLKLSGITSTILPQLSTAFQIVSSITIPEKLILNVFSLFRSRSSYKLNRFANHETSLAYTLRVRGNTPSRVYHIRSVSKRRSGLESKAKKNLFGLPYKNKNTTFKTSTAYKDVL